MEARDENSRCQNHQQQITELDHIVRGVDGNNGLRGRVKTLEEAVKSIDRKFVWLVILLVANGALNAKDLLPW